MRKKVKGSHKEIKDQHLANIESILTSKQRVIFKKIQKKYEKKKQRRRQGFQLVKPNNL